VIDGLFTTLVDGEGRDQLDACMAATFEHCRTYGLDTVVIYTANGIGPCLAVDRYLSRPEFVNMRIVAVTPPANKPYMGNPLAARGASNTVRTGIFGDRRKQLIEAKVPIVSARLPFRSPISATPATEDVPPLDPMQIVDRAFGVLGGGFSLCVQAVMMACDAGYVASGELVAAMSADTAIVAYAAHSEDFISPKKGLLVLHIICKPTVYKLSKSAHEYTLFSIEQAEEPTQVPLPLEAGEVIEATASAKSPSDDSAPSEDPKPDEPNTGSGGNE
jgi:uncharacterized protein